MNAKLSPVSAHPELEAFWMPFTANRQFKSNPRLLARAEGMYYWTADGREVLDAVAGLWCVWWAFFGSSLGLSIFFAWVRWGEPEFPRRRGNTA